MFKQHSKVWAAVCEYGLITIATLIMVVGIYVFKFPNNFSFGGVSGMAVLLAKLTSITAGDWTFLLNMVLLVLGFFFLGRSFGIKTVYVSVLMSVALSGMEKLFPMTQPLTTQPVLELIFAIFLPSLSAAILFNIGASGGGTDILAMILKKYTSFNIGSALFVVDLLITVAACFVFDPTTGLFSFTGLMAKSLVIDGVIENINLCKYFTIVCDEPDPICDFIHDELKRSATIFKGEGTYTHQQKFIILTVMKRSQAVQLRNFLKQNEPGAFMMITNSSEIIGKGFRGFNLKKEQHFRSERICCSFLRGQIVFDFPQKEQKLFHLFFGHSFYKKCFRLMNVVPDLIVKLLSLVREKNLLQSGVRRDRNPKNIALLLHDLKDSRHR